MTSSESQTSFQHPDEINIQQGDMAEPQVQVLDLKTQKNSIETQPGQLRSSYDEPAADLKELKNANARVAELESVSAMRKKMLLALTEELDREKKSRELLSSELSSKADLISEFQQKLQTSQSSQQELEKTIKKGEKEIAEIQNLPRDLKAQQIPTEPSTAIDDVKKKSTSKSESSGEQDESSRPSDIIDWVLKKKAK